MDKWNGRTCWTWKQKTRKPDFPILIHLVQYLYFHLLIHQIQQHCTALTSGLKAFAYQHSAKTSSLLPFHICQAHPTCTLHVAQRCPYAAHSLSQVIMASWLPPTEWPRMAQQQPNVSVLLMLSGWNHSMKREWCSANCSYGKFAQL